MSRGHVESSGVRCLNCGDLLPQGGLTGLICEPCLQGKDPMTMPADDTAIPQIQELSTPTTTGGNMSIDPRLTNPLHWTHFPKLPLIRKRSIVIPTLSFETQIEVSETLGFLLSDDKLKVDPHVIIGNMLLDLTKVDRLLVIEYKDWETLLLDWKVDS